MQHFIELKTSDQGHQTGCGEQVDQTREPVQAYRISLLTFSPLTRKICN